MAGFRTSQDNNSEMENVKEKKTNKQREWGLNGEDKIRHN